MHGIGLKVTKKGCLDKLFETVSADARLLWESFGNLSKWLKNLARLFDPNELRLVHFLSRQSFLNEQKKIPAIAFHRYLEVHNLSNKW